MEVVASHFASTDTDYLAEFKRRLKGAHSRLVDIPELEHGTGLSARDLCAQLRSELAKDG